MFLVPKILDTADAVTGESKFDQMLNSNLMAKLQLGRLGWIKWRPGRELNGWEKLTELFNICNNYKGESECRPRFQIQVLTETFKT